MKILIVEENNKLANLLRRTSDLLVEEAEFIDGTEDADFYIVSEKLVSYEKLLAVIMSNHKQINKKRKIFFIYHYAYDKNIFNNMKTICQLNGIELISSNLSDDEIIKKILNGLVFETSELSNVITFFGADNKVGTTMLTHSVAETLAKNTELSIGLLCLNNNPSREYLKSDLDTGIDNIKINLFNNILDGDELVHACIKETEGLYILPGVSYSPDAKLFHPEHIKGLIEMAAHKFDLVLIDAGGNIDSGLAIASIKMAKIKYLIVTQQEAVRKNFKRVETQVLHNLGIDIKQFMLVANKYISSDFMYNSQQLGSIYGTILATVVPHTDFYGWKAEVERKTLLHYGLKGYNNQIDYLCRIIAMQIRQPYQVETRQGLIRKKINSLGGM
jgi:cellulose biosynthesis protein BcsQ